jgi:hypothetical protein
MAQRGQAAVGGEGAGQRVCDERPRAAALLRRADQRPHPRDLQLLRRGTATARPERQERPAGRLVRGVGRGGLNQDRVYAEHAGVGTVGGPGLERHGPVHGRAVGDRSGQLVRRPHTRQRTRLRVLAAGGEAGHRRAVAEPLGAGLSLHRDARYGRAGTVEQRPAHRDGRARSRELGAHRVDRDGERVRFSRVRS